MVIRVWSSHGEPINRVAKWGVRYEAEPEIPQWILRDRTKEGLTEQFIHQFKWIEIAAIPSDSAVEAIAKRKGQINPLEYAERIIARLIDCIPSPQLCVFCIQVIAGNLQHLQRVKRWTAPVRRYFQTRLSEVRSELPEEAFKTFDHLLQIAAAPESVPSASAQPTIKFTTRPTGDRKTRSKKSVPKAAISKRLKRLMKAQGF